MTDQGNKFFDIQSIEIPTGEIKVNTVTILVVDRKGSLVIEKTDDSKETFIGAIGLATYSIQSTNCLIICFNL